MNYLNKEDAYEYFKGLTKLMLMTALFISYWLSLVSPNWLSYLSSFCLISFNNRIEQQIIIRASRSDF